MPLVVLPILRISFSQFPIMDHKQVLRIVLLGGLGKVERPGDDPLPVNDHDFALNNGVNVIYCDRYS